MTLCARVAELIERDLRTAILDRARDTRAARQKISDEPLDALGIKHATVKHPPVFTVEQAAALRGEVPGGHTKNLFLRDKKGAFYLVVALEDAAIALKDLHRRLGASGRFSFGSAEAMGEFLGVVPGSVTPFAAINDTSSVVAAGYK